MYGDKGAIPVELQLLVSLFQLLYSTLSPTEGSHETSKTDAQASSKLFHTSEHITVKLYWQTCLPQCFCHRILAKVDSDFHPALSRISANETSLSFALNVEADLVL